MAAPERYTGRVGADGAGIRVTGACGCSDTVAAARFDVRGFGKSNAVNVDVRGDPSLSSASWWAANATPGLVPVFAHANSSDPRERNFPSTVLAGFGFFWICWAEDGARRRLPPRQPRADAAIAPGTPVHRSSST